MNSVQATTAAAPMTQHAPSVFARSLLIGLMAFLTLVDLFATQAILPSLAAAYQVTPAAMGTAVNASTIGMAVAALIMAFVGRRIDRRLGILTALALLSVPTAALAVAPDLTTFTLLRIAQGLCMATAFALTLSYLAEHCSAMDTAGAFAAYITGNVASNLVGRLMSAALADTLGLAGNFLVFAALNLAGGVLVYFALSHSSAMPAASMGLRAAFATLANHWRNPALRTSFVIGFLILFVFIGTFTYVNFVLARPPIALSPMSLGFVYFVFLPSIFTTPLAGKTVQRYGARPTFFSGMAVALVGLPLLLIPSLVPMLIGLVCIGAGTFFAQATTTGFVGRAATGDPGSASGMYLACYFAGGMAGAALIGQVFDRFGWDAAVIAIGAALLVATALGRALVLRPAATTTATA